jgi:hypothetical protein
LRADTEKLFQTFVRTCLKILRLAAFGPLPTLPRLRKMLLLESVHHLNHFCMYSYLDE